MDDRVFVSRGRVVMTGVLRLAGFGAAALGVLGVVEASLAMTIERSLGRAPALGMVSLAREAALLLGGVVLWGVAPWLSRRALRMPAGKWQCSKCRYPLEGLEGDRCPECGTEVR